MDIYDVSHVSVTNSQFRLKLHPYVNTSYMDFIKSEYFKNTVILLLNRTPTRFGFPSVRGLIPLTQQLRV